jgi:hypothetical protein
MTRSTVFVALLVAAALCGCSSESPSSTPVSGPPQASPPANQPPVVRSAWVEPNPVVRTEESVRVAVDAYDPDGHAVTLRHQWFVNGQPVPGANGPTLPPQLLNRGDRVSVEVLPLDASGQGEAFRSEAVEVANTPPAVKTLRLKPFPPRAGDRLTAYVEAEDLDHDDISYMFRWRRNNEVVSEGEARALDLTGYQRGERILLEVLVADDEAMGLPMRSRPIEVVNSPPEITSRPPARTQGKRYEYRLAATDRDGDDLVYRLEHGPPEMEFDEETHTIRWFPADNINGTFRVRVSVSDGQGDEPTVQEFDLTIGGGSPAETPKTPVPPATPESAQSPERTETQETPETSETPQG